MNEFYQQFKIDDHLKRYESALRNLSYEGQYPYPSQEWSHVKLPYSGLERFDEALAYVEKHRLYKAAIAIWKGTPQYKAMLTFI